MEKIPNFQTYNEVENWIKRKSKMYGGKKFFTSSLEYKNAYPHILKLYNIQQNKLSNNVKKALKISKLNYGDLVEWSYGDPFGNITIIEGTLIKQNDMPFVLDSNGKKHKWHNGYWKVKT